MARLITVLCSNGVGLHTDGENIIIVSGRSEETIPISRVQSFTLKEPGLAYGKITFTTAQAATARVNLGFGVSAAIGAEKTFFYSKDNLEAAEQFRDAVMNYQKRVSQPDPTSTSTVGSVTEEIRGLKALLDEGILTQDEFDTKKKQLLGL